MSVEDLFTDHLELLRRPSDAGTDSIGHPLDTFETIDDFWAMLQRDGNVAARTAAGIIDLSPISALIPPWLEIQIANDRVRVIYSEIFPEGTILRFQDVGTPAAGAEFREARLLEELPE